MGIIFAPYGNSKEFYKTKKSSLDAPKYVSSLGFNGYEYLCNAGVHISDDACEILKKNAKKYNVSLSVRAYDLISLSNEDDRERQKSIDILCKTVSKAYLSGAKRVVFPLDNCAVRARRDVFNATKSSLEKVLFYMKENGIDDLFLCPETMGLIHELGTVDEVIGLCLSDERIMPALNLGNIYARNQGRVFLEEDFLLMFDKMKKKLGKSRGENFHLYLSKVEYTNHGFRSDINFSECDDKNQKFESLFKTVRKRKLTPFVVCKSPEDKEKDLNTLKNICENSSLTGV